MRSGSFSHGRRFTHPTSPFTHPTSPFTHRTSPFTHPTSPFPHRASPLRIPPHLSRIAHHFSPFPHRTSPFTVHPSHITFHASHNIAPPSPFTHRTSPPLSRIAHLERTPPCKTSDASFQDAKRNSPPPPSPTARTSASPPFRAERLTAEHLTKYLTAVCQKGSKRCLIPIRSGYVSDASRASPAAVLDSDEILIRSGCEFRCITSFSCSGA